MSPWYNFDVSVLYERLLEIASEQHGLISSRQAKERFGIPQQRLVKLHDRGKLEKCQHGIYRITAMPVTEYTHLAEAVLWSKNGGITGETALNLWDLGDVAPRKTHIAVHGRIRRTTPANYQIHAVPANTQFEETFSILTTTPRLAFEIAIKNGTPGHIIRPALRKAETLELVGPRTVAKTLTALYERS